MIRANVVFSGHVQGVFFRATTVQVAREHAVTGWVRNEPDGTVRCVVEGADDEVHRFLEAVKKAKEPNIDNVTIAK